MFHCSQSKGFVTIAVLIIILQLAIFINTMLDSIAMQHQINQNIVLREQLKRTLQNELLAQWNNIQINQIQSARLQTVTLPQHYDNDNYQITTELSLINTDIFQMTSYFQGQMQLLQFHRQILVFSSTNNIVMQPTLL